jgi:hypothetical protein
MTFLPNLGGAVGPIVAAFVAALGIAFVLTPLVRRVVLRYEIADRFPVPGLPEA